MRVFSPLFGPRMIKVNEKRLVSNAALCAQAAASLRSVQTITDNATVRYLLAMFDDAENHDWLVAHAVPVNRSCLDLITAFDDAMSDLRATERIMRRGE